MLQTLFVVAVAGLLSLGAIALISPALAQCDTADGLCAHRPHVVIEMVSPAAIIGTVVGGAVLLLSRVTDRLQN